MFPVWGRPRYAMAVKRKQVNFQQKYSLLTWQMRLWCSYLQYSLFILRISCRMNVCAQPKPHQSNNVTQWEFYQNRDYVGFLNYYYYSLYIQKFECYQWFTDLILLVLPVEVWFFMKCRNFLWVLWGLGLDMFKCLVAYKKVWVFSVRYNLKALLNVLVLLLLVI